MWGENLSICVPRLLSIAITDCDPCEPCESCENPCENVCTNKSYKRNLWGLGYGNGGVSQFDGNTYGYNQSFGGTIIGTDREYKRGTRLGGYFSYGEGRISSVLLDRSKSQEFLAGLYYRKNMYNGYVLANAGLGNVQYDTQRTISFVGRRATSKHDAFVGTVYAERGFDFATKLGRLQPYLGVQYIGNRQDKFTEKGAGSLNLIGKRTETDSFRSLLGTRLQSKVRGYNGGRLNANTNIAWLHEYADSTTSFTAGLAGSPISTANFTVRGNNTRRDWAIFGVGLNYEKNRIRLFGGYDSYANNQQVLHTGNAGVAYSW
ncbi:MAG: autotransporter outer membrane beta-barrel domain-containing protein [Planctomycetaceae bacterium]|nr:autotransporter outer membrane beta-barrel domain-containing protein [Planctomycetaceae bacterium]